LEKFEKFERISIQDNMLAMDAWFLQQAEIDPRRYRSSHKEGKDPQPDANHCWEEAALNKADKTRNKRRMRHGGFMMPDQVWTE